MAEESPAEPAPSPNTAPAAPAAPAQGLLGRLADHALGDAAFVLAVLGGLLYGLIALGYDRFYGDLGLSPEDVGHTQGALVARTGAALGFLLVIVAVAVLLPCGLLLLLRPATDAGTCVVASLAAGAVLGTLCVGVVAPVIWHPPLVGYVLGLLTLVLLALSLTGWLLRVWRDRPRASQGALALWGAVLGIGYLVGVQFAQLRMEGLADQVKDGLPLQGITFVFDVQADPVLVRPVSGGGPKEQTHALFLGEAAGVVAYYDPAQRRTVRRAADSVVLEFVPVCEVPRLARSPYCLGG